MGILKFVKNLFKEKSEAKPVLDKINPIVETIVNSEVKVVKTAKKETKKPKPVVKATKTTKATNVKSKRTK